VAETNFGFGILNAAKWIHTFVLLTMKNVPAHGQNVSGVIIHAAYFV
jgi:hypothetical protein